MVILTNKLDCKLQLNNHTIEASSHIELAKRDAEKLLIDYPDFVKLKTKKKNGR